MHDAGRKNGQIQRARSHGCSLLRIDDGAIFNDKTVRLKGALIGKCRFPTEGENLVRRLPLRASLSVGNAWHCPVAEEPEEPSVAVGA
jgi:hypothetical protein